jgi:hypothetical protein
LSHHAKYIWHNCRADYNDTSAAKLYAVDRASDRSLCRIGNSGVGRTTAKNPVAATAIARPATPPLAIGTPRNFDATHALIFNRWDHPDTKQEC